MESYIKIKATLPEMEKFFDDNGVCSARYYILLADGLFDVRVRHAERKRYLSGIYTIPQLIAELQQSKGKG